jgi:hypothetical protein
MILGTPKCVITASTDGPSGWILLDNGWHPVGFSPDILFLVIDAHHDEVVAVEPSGAPVTLVCLTSGYVFKFVTNEGSAMFATCDVIPWKE